MSKLAKYLIDARADAPERVRGLDLDAWLLPTILEVLEPRQRDMLEWLLVGRSDEPLPTSDICDLIGTTPERAGLTLSRLRRLGLVETIYRTDEHGRRAYHRAVAWVRAAAEHSKQQLHAAWREMLAEVKRIREVQS